MKENYQMKFKCLNYSIDFMWKLCCKDFFTINNSHFFIGKQQNIKGTVATVVNLTEPI